MVLGKIPVSGHPTNLEGQGPTALAISVGGGCLDIFSRLSFTLFPPPRSNID